MKSTTEYDFQHAEDVGQILDSLAPKLSTHATLSCVVWGRYAFLTPEETASLALCGFEVGDTHGC